MARRFARVFDGAGAVVYPSASCAGMLRQQVEAPVHELSEILVDVLGIDDVGAYFRIG